MLFRVEKTPKTNIIRTVKKKYIFSKCRDFPLRTWEVKKFLCILFYFLDFTYAKATNYRTYYFVCLNYCEGVGGIWERRLQGDKTIRKTRLISLYFLHLFLVVIFFFVVVALASLCVRRQVFLEFISLSIIITNGNILMRDLCIVMVS